MPLFYPTTQLRYGKRETELFYKLALPAGRFIPSFCFVKPLRLPFLHLHSFISLPAFSAPQQAWLSHFSQQIPPHSHFLLFFLVFSLSFFYFSPVGKSNSFPPPFICVMHSFTTPAFFPTFPMVCFLFP